MRTPEGPAAKTRPVVLHIPHDWSDQRVGWFSGEFEHYGTVVFDDLDGLVHVQFDDGSDGWFSAGDLFLI